MTVESAAKTSVFHLNKLPSKLKVWVQYADNFVRVLYSKTPWHSYVQRNAADAGYSEMYFDVFYDYKVVKDISLLASTKFMHQVHFISKDRTKSVSIATTPDGLVHVKSGQIDTVEVDFKVDYERDQARLPEDLKHYVKIFHEWERKFKTHLPTIMQRAEGLSPVERADSILAHVHN